MIVLDTHAVIWVIQGDERLGTQARRAIDAARVDGRAMLSAFSVWEMAHLDRSGRVPFPGGALAWIRGVLSLPGFGLVPFDPVIAVDSVALEWGHKDPADRIIVATARHLGCPLATADEKILRYAAAGHVEAIDARG